MDFFLLLLGVCFLIFLCVIYLISEEDMVLIRRNITKEQVFDAAFVCAFAGLVSARIGYVVFHFDASYLNPFVLLSFPKLPGLSLFGGVIGGGISFYYYARKKRMPFEKLLDMFAVSFLCASPLGFFGYALLTRQQNALPYSIVALVYLLLAILTLRFLIRWNLKQGSLGYLVVSVTSLLSFFASFFDGKDTLFLVFTIESILWFFLFIVSVVLFAQKERKILSTLPLVGLILR